MELLRAEPDTPAPASTDKYADLVAEQLSILGEDPDREGLIKTPERVAKAMEVLETGTKYTG